MKPIKRWYQLSNGYWLKIFLFRPMPMCLSGFERSKEYLLDIAVGKTKRIVNDHYSRHRKSPKSLYNKSTNKSKGTGLEVFMKVLDFLKLYEQILPKGSVIRVEGSDDKRIRVYRRLLRYGFIESSWYAPHCWWHKKTFYFKEIK